MPARILLIEDDEASLGLVTYVLSAFGHTVFQTHDGEEGLEVARRELPDLILTDLQMPKTDGYGVVRALRKDPRFQNRPIVAVTSYAMRDDRERVLASGFDGYISKPIMPEEFVHQVERFLDAGKRSAPPPAPAAESRTPAPVRCHTTILAVDNSPVNLRLLDSTLGPLGYKVILAATALQALAIARENPPDLILSDLHMPEMDGYDFFKTIQADPQLKPIPFAILSSTVWQQDELTRASEMAVATFIRRPIDPQCLVQEIQAALAAARSQSPAAPPTDADRRAAKA